MADYAKKKNDELAALCKERGLAHTGKKADLVKRLEDDDTSKSNGASTEEKPSSGNVKEPEAQSDTAPVAPAAAEEKAEDANGDATADAPAKEEGDKTAEKPTEEKAPAQDFSLGLQDTTLDEEIEKRKKRAAKFGLDPKSDETLKQLERAKRFGNTNLPGLLNQALPERGERNKKRGREAKEGKEDKEDKEDKPDRKRSRQRAAPKDESKAAKSENGSYPSWMTTEDRARADKRKAKFGAEK